MSLEKRIESESKAVVRIANCNLQCKDCLCRYDDTVKLGNTSRCQMFVKKPNEVLNGGECVLYVKE